MSDKQNQANDVTDDASDANGTDKTEKPSAPKEIGGRKGPEPTRYGDWEKNGIISDF